MLDQSPVAPLGTGTLDQLPAAPLGTGPVGTGGRQQVQSPMAGDSSFLTPHFSFYELVTNFHDF